MSKLSEFLFYEKQYNEIGSIIYTIEKFDPIIYGKRIGNKQLEFMQNIYKKLKEIHYDLFLVMEELREIFESQSKEGSND